MIKTVSFAPSRSASGRAKASKADASGSSASNPAPRRATKHTASPKTAPAKTVSAAAARAALEKNAPAKMSKSVAPAKAMPAKAAPAKAAPAKAAPEKSGKAKATPAPPNASRKRVRSANASAEQARVGEATLAPAPDVAVESKFDATETVAPAKSQVAPRVKRARVPKDLAAQYGGATEEAPRRAVENAETPRKRLSKAKREARSQLVRPDDGVLQRLARAGEVARPAAPKRARGWEFECGCCGRVARFQTPGALCECGAIAVRE